MFFLAYRIPLQKCVNVWEVGVRSDRPARRAKGRDGCGGVGVIGVWFSMSFAGFQPAEACLVEAPAANMSAQ